jgi:hypothetical protein
MQLSTRVSIAEVREKSRAIQGFGEKFWVLRVSGTRVEVEWSAEAGKVEVDGDGVAFGGSDLDGDEIGGEGGGGEFQIEGSAPRTARAIATAAIERVAARIGGRKNLVTVIDLDAKVSPEIIGARYESRRRAGW